MYAYVGGDPINGTDQTGLSCEFHHYKDVGLNKDGTPNPKDVIHDYGITGGCTDDFSTISDPSGHIPAGRDSRQTDDDATVVVVKAHSKNRYSQFRKFILIDTPSATDPCANRNARGICVFIRDENGKLQVTPEYAAMSCDNYKAMMTSNGQVAGVAALPGTVAMANGMTGGSVSWLNKVSNWLGGAPLGVITGIAGLTTGALSYDGDQSLFGTKVPGGRPAGCS